MPHTTSLLDMAVSLEAPSLPGLRTADEEQPRESGTVEVGQMMTREIREGAEDLKEAARQSLNIILDLGMNGIVRWVSPSWADVVGTPSESIEGKPIADILLDDKTVFAEAVESLKRDDSRSQIIRFSVRMGPLSKLLSPSSGVKVEEEEAQGPGELKSEGVVEEEPTLTLEGQGIMVYDRSSAGESHVCPCLSLTDRAVTDLKQTMWMIRPPIQPREITIDLPAQLVDSLGVGAEMLAKYLTALAEAGVDDPANFPPPPPELCRICERQIQPWWFEKHTDLCAQEHRAEMEVQLAQENLIDHRNTIVRILDALETRNGRPTSGETTINAPPLAEYKGLHIGQWSPPSSAASSGTASPTNRLSRSREQSTSGLGHVRTRSVAARRPLTRVVELVLDLCDTAIDIDISANRDPSSIKGEVAAQTSKVDASIRQVLHWQSPGTNTLEQERGLAVLCADTERAARAKVEAILRHRRIVEYAERIRVEYSVIVQDCVEAAMRKAARLAAGESGESSEDEDEQEEILSHHSEPLTVHASVDVQPLPDDPLRSNSDPTLDMTGESSASLPISTRSSSPRECPTPKSNRGPCNGFGPAQASKRSSMFFESDIGDSDSSVRSSNISGLRRTESPASEYGLSRASSCRDRNRRSIVLPDMGSQPRQPSPPKDGLAHSPLKLNQLRISNYQETAPSPVTSPLLAGGEIYFPTPYPNSYPLVNQHHSRHNHHHRRQSSAASADVLRATVSPHPTGLSPAQARAVPPSIKDFEIIKPISKGAFGSVYLAKKKSTGDYYAIKVLKKADMVAKNQVTNVKAERAIMMRQGESDYVAKLYWTFSSKDYLYLVMEYLNGGDCASLIKSLGGLPEDWAKRYVAEVVVCVQDLHKRGIVHRDLKPDNLLIDQKGHLKLTDFGLSRMGLIKRQKRVLNSEENDSVPDLLKQGPFLRPISVASSRSASFDFHGTQSPGSTPSMTPDLAAGLAQPSYFSLGREYSNGREQFRRTSGYRSDSGGSETLQAMFNSFSLTEPATFSVSSRNSRIGEETRSEVGDESPDLYPLQPVDSQSSISLQRATPPQNNMMPPPLALFDPEDNSRRFVGTPDYLAPETINGVGQDEMSDWWSLGCILFELLYGYPPFHADTPDKVFENILQRRIDWPSDEDCPVSPEAKDIMNKLMCSDPRQRLGANREGKFASGGEEIKRHPWFDGVNWDTLFQDEAQFIPAPEHAEDTEYFDSRGASLQTFTEEFEDQVSSPAMTPGVENLERPHDALSKVRTQVNSLKRSLMPLHIPPHVRDNRTRRLSEPVPADDFGTFAFKNLPVLEKANKDVIRKLRAEAGHCQSRTSSLCNPSIGSSPAPSLEGSPTTKQMSLKSQHSTHCPNRPVSPSGGHPANASPSRPSQPTSPLLVSFTTAQNHQRRKTSSASSSISHQSTNSLQPGSFFEVSRLSSNVSVNSVASSPIKTTKGPLPFPASPQRGPSGRQLGGTTSRARSQTVGSQEGGSPAKDILLNQKRRSAVFEASPSSSDTEESRANALLRVQRRRQHSRRKSRNIMMDVPFFRPLDVLIAEDHPVSRIVMEKLLQKLFCRTITVDNGPDAMRYATSEIKFDIIFMEYKLPQINGADVARMIRDTKNANARTPIVAVTGYLKELQAPHHFDAMIDKPPTTSKLIDIIGKLCQWKPPPPGCDATQVRTRPSSNLRQESIRAEDSPSSASSVFTNMPGGTFRGSSREDSISSSFFGDFESVNTDDAPVIVGKLAMSEWVDAGLGISEEAIAGGGVTKSKIIDVPPLLQQQSAPPALQTKMPVRQRSAEKIKAKRDEFEKKMRDCGESGDDEDEELGDVQVRAKSPQRKEQRTSKLGLEMMRTNSRGSVVSGSDVSFKDCLTEPATMIPEEGTLNVDHLTSSITPPQIFPPIPGDAVANITAVDNTPRASMSLGLVDEEPTPRAQSTAPMVEDGMTLIGEG